jgi:hypothetical protein
MGRRLGHIVTFTKLRVSQPFTPNDQKGFLSRNKNRLPASDAIGWFVKDGENSTAFLHRSEGRKWHLADIPATSALSIFGPKQTKANSSSRYFCDFCVLRAAAGSCVAVVATVLRYKPFICGFVA